MSCTGSEVKKRKFITDKGTFSAKAEYSKQGITTNKSNNKIVIDSVCVYYPDGKSFELDSKYYITDNDFNTLHTDNLSVRDENILNRK
ncbi:MAG TPA: hypothetical protein DC057_08200 [Spirochaetia bacterium]|nr:hypothetical protein [Spirochaetia bacterium]